MTSREKDVLAEAALIAMEHVSGKRPGILTLWATAKDGSKVRVVVVTPQALANLSIESDGKKKGRPAK